MILSLVAGVIAGYALTDARWRIKWQRDVDERVRASRRVPPRTPGRPS